MVNDAILGAGFPAPRCVELHVSGARRPWTARRRREQVADVQGGADLSIVVPKLRVTLLSVIVGDAAHGGKASQRHSWCTLCGYGEHPIRVG